MNDTTISIERTTAWERVDRGPAHDFDRWHLIRNGDGDLIGRATYGAAALIVAAVNDYDRLRAIEKAARAWLAADAAVLDEPFGDECVDKQALALAAKDALREALR